MQSSDRSSGGGGQGGDSSGENRTPAMTGGADEKQKTKPSPSAEDAMPGDAPATPTPPG